MLTRLTLLYSAGNNTYLLLRGNEFIFPAAQNCILSKNKLPVNVNVLFLSLFCFFNTLIYFS